VAITISVHNKIGEIEPAACPQRIPQWKLWKIATNHLKLGVYPANQFNLITHIDQNSSPVKALVLTASLLPASTKASRDWKFENVGCPGCLSDAAEPTLRRTIQSLPLEFSRCLDCGLIYQTPRLTRESLSSYFSSETFIQDPNGDNLDELLGYPNYFDWDKSYAVTAKLRLDRIRRFKRPPGELLEIGSATGSFLAAARSFGFRVRGLDLSSRFAAFARNRYDLNIDVGYVEEFAMPRSHYDVICSFGGIACWRDPIQALANIREALKLDGIFVMNHFDIDSLPGKILGNHHFEYNHASLVIFSRQTMRQCLAHAGFEQVYSQSERQYASFGRIAGYLKLKAILKAFRRIGLENVTIPLIAPGTVFAICCRTPYSIRRRSDVFDPHIIGAPTMRAA
jgi:SAM-dependent methyltransferase